MGGLLAKRGVGQKPKLLIWAAKDPGNANLDRVQVIKGWIENGEQKEKIYDVACSDSQMPDVASGRCPESRAQVNLDSCQITEGNGNSILKVLWEDESFNPDHAAFYYVRVLQNPTCRWSTFDAIRLGIPPVAEVSPTVQERAWSSPIWYSPPSADVK
jgi:hypothetical protein